MTTSEPDFGYNIGDYVWTYSRRGGVKPEPVLVQILAIIVIEQFYPATKYLINIDGVLAVRDRYTVARRDAGYENIPIVINAEPRLGTTISKDYTYDD